MVKAPIPVKHIISPNQTTVFVSISSTHHKHNLLTWKHQILQDLRSSGCGIDETYMSVLQSFLSMVTPQTDGGKHNKDMWFHFTE